MSKQIKSKSYFNGKLPKFTSKELNSVANAKPSALLLKAVRLLRESEENQRAT
jgi:hypothetical protein